MDNFNKYKRLRALVCDLNEDTISEEQMAELNNILASDPGAVEYYVNLIDVQTHVRVILSNSTIDKNDDIHEKDRVELLQSLVENENNACPIEIAKEIEEDNEQVVKTQKLKKLNKFYQLYSTLVSIAAVLMILFIVYVNVFPPQYTVPVATVEDQIGAKWSYESDKLNVSDRVMINQPPYILEEGIVKISYDDGVELIIEGPAEFVIEKKGVGLTRGSLFAHVPSSGLGFTVDTANTRFIDLGTDFGVYAGNNDSAELHVLKGEVQYCSHFPDVQNSSKTIMENNARRFIAQTKGIQAIPVADEFFVRQIDSKAGFIWRGQKEMDLADIVGGGNGFGTGKLNTIIEANSGHIRAEGRSVLNLDERKGDAKYHLASEVRYVDGIFVPDGVIQVSSDGNVCNEFPDTSGLYSCDLLYGSLNWPARPLVLDGVEYGTSRNHSLFMHANLGVTFDIAKIRSDLKRAHISEFKTRVGISESANGLEWANIDVWILFDGEVAYQKKDIKSGDIDDISVSIPDNTQYLTIAITEGKLLDSVKEAYELSGDVSDLSSDWCVVANPILILE